MILGSGLLIAGVAFLIFLTYLFVSMAYSFSQTDPAHGSVAPRLQRLGPNVVCSCRNWGWHL